MTPEDVDIWAETNKRYLMDLVGAVQQKLELAAARLEAGDGAEGQAAVPAIAGEATPFPSSLAAPASIDRLTTVFGLTGFERDILLLCAGVELVSSFAGLCAAAQGDARRAFPTFSLALAALPDAHWSAISPGRPLRRFRLIEVQQATAVTLSPLRIDEKVLHFLTGVFALDERLAGFLETVEVPSNLPTSHREHVKRIVTSLSRAEPRRQVPVVELLGPLSAGKREVAASACAALGLSLYLVTAADVPAATAERDSFATLWEREAVLGPAALLIDCHDAGAERLHVVRSFARRLAGVVVLATDDSVQVRGRSTLSVRVENPGSDEQLELWSTAMGPELASDRAELEPVLAQFRLDVDQIRAAAEAMRNHVALPGEASGDHAHALWDTLRIATRGKLDHLAQRIESVATWEDLVLPPGPLEMLHDIAAQVRQRSVVYETWGFGRRLAGLGISVLFSGASGTGKTMAAEVLANELRLDLYRIDLSQVVSKYIGETEKNLRRAFDAADEGGAILLFDEADALFGKRSEIKDSHDRYANIEVSYLLQRMEQYRGLAILTTNLKSALDQAFLRRLRFTVQFPFPDAAQRMEIWRRVFPSGTPVDRLDVGRLAQLSTAGGNIRNIALNAAFLAAEAREPVRMSHLLRAARSEYAKLEKPLTTAEVGGWV
jgi:hypothetical protein